MSNRGSTGQPGQRRQAPRTGQSPRAGQARRPSHTPRPDPRTFRRRRIVALLIVVILLGGIIAGAWALKNRFFPSAASEPEPAPSQSTGPSEEDLANPTDCAVESLALSVDLAADSLPAGQPANIPITVENTGEIPCLVDVGKDALTLTISSGDDTVWSTRHCSGGLPEERQLLLDVDAKDTTVLAWDGDRSKKGCSEDQEQAKPGTYRVKVSLESGSAELDEEQVFGLH